MTDVTKGKMSVAEAGRKGGRKTAMTHGREFYEEIGRKGGETTSATHGAEFFSEIGSIGGTQRAANKMYSEKQEAPQKKQQEVGDEFYRDIGRKGGERVRKLIQEGKEKEEE